MILVNMTPHAIVFCDAAGNPLHTMEPSGSLVRCSTERSVVGEMSFNGISVPLAEVKLGSVNGLPEPVEGTFYVVSAIAGQAAKAAGRQDVLLVDDAVRDSAGRVVGCRALARP